MIRIELTLGQLPKLLQKHAAEAPAAIARGLMKAAVHAQADLKAAKQPRDRGLFAAAWTVSSANGNVVLHNSAPYAGILERGARPHPVSKAGREAIREWVIRKGVLFVAGKGDRQVRVTGRNKDRYESAIDSAVWAICAKIKREGQKPLWVVRDRMPKFRRYLKEELELELDKLLGSKP